MIKATWTLDIEAAIETYVAEYHGHKLEVVYDEPEFQVEINGIFQWKVFVDGELQNDDKEINSKVDAMELAEMLAPAKNVLTKP